MIRANEFTAIILLVLSIAAMGMTGPLYAETYTLKRNVEIKELFTLGVDDESAKVDAPDLFYTIFQVFPGRQGELYVLDNKANCVKVFDKKGKYLKKLFREGHGPKEIFEPAGLAINHFNDHIYVLQDYGFTLKEFDASGNCVKRHNLPQQFYYYFEFVKKNKFLYVAMNNENTPFFNTVKLLNLNTGKIEKEFVKTNDDNPHGDSIRFHLKDNILWIVPSERMALLKYDAVTGKELQEFQIPGRFIKSVIKKTPVAAGHVLTRICFNAAQLIAVEGRIFVLVIRRQYRREKNSYEKYPFKTDHQLWLLEGGKLVEIGNLKGFDFMLLECVWKNRVYFSTDVPYPKIKVIEINKKQINSACISGDPEGE